MADNWSGSVLTLAGQGDWAEWSFDVPDSTAVDHLNGDSSGTEGTFAIRGAFPGPAATAVLAVIVNDTWIKFMDESSRPAGGQSSDSSWVSADRFQPVSVYSFQGYGTLNVNPGGADDGPFNFGYPIPAEVPSGPFVVGTNTIRLVNVGETSVEIDFFYMATGSVVTPSLGLDSVAETAPAGFAGHTDPNADTFNLSGDHEWIGKAPDATTGTAQLAALWIEKFCPGAIGDAFTTKVLMTDYSLTPIVGETVWLVDTGASTIETETTDSDGIATFTGLTSGSGGVYLYLGGPTWLPTALSVPADSRQGCSGWALGRIGVG